MLYITFYTPEYEPDAMQLVETLNKFSLPHRLYPYNPIGGWILNCSYKYIALLDALKTAPCPVVVLDADARIMQMPSLFEDIQRDKLIYFAAHLHPNNYCPIQYQPELCDGTLYATQDAIPTIERMITLCQDVSKIDQRHLQDMMLQRKYENFYNLPASYCRMNNHLQDGAGAVIYHDQASRRLRKD